MTTQCTLHLVALKSGTPLADFASLLRRSSLTLYLKGRVSGWAVSPTHLSMGTYSRDDTWDAAVLLPASDTLPRLIMDLVATHSQLEASFPNEMLSYLTESNHKFLNPQGKDVPALSVEWSNNAPHQRPPATHVTPAKTNAPVGEILLTPERAAWMCGHGEKPDGAGAVTMLNLMAYVPDTGKAKMMAYMAAIQSAFTEKYGVAAKLFGTVDSYDGREKDLKDKGFAWEECAMVHYPSIWHFGEMVTSPEYAAIESAHKVGAMRDVCILCISETGL